MIMTRKLNVTGKTTERRTRRVPVVRRAAGFVDRRERRRFINLAYRLVHCLDAEEELRLKDEAVRLVLRRREEAES